MSGATNKDEQGVTQLFKFRAINKHLIDSLVMSRLWCAKPDTLNDPLDCQINLHAACRRASNLATGKDKTFLNRLLQQTDIFEKLEQPLKESGICSFSKNLYSDLSWSHYADEHRGVCLLYRFQDAFLLDPKNKLVGISQVTYLENALTNWLTNISTFSNSTDEIADVFLKGLVKKYLTVKSPAWEYEQEVRIILHRPGYLNIPRGELVQVCFGLRTPKADIELVKKLAIEHCGCKVFSQIIHDESSDFGFSVIEI